MCVEAVKNSGPSTCIWIHSVKLCWQCERYWKLILPSIEVLNDAGVQIDLITNPVFRDNLYTEHCKCIFIIIFVRYLMYHWYGLRDIKQTL